MLKITHVLMILLSISIMSSCSIRKMAINEISEMAGNGMVAFEQDDDLNLVLKALPANIKLFEVLLVNDPKNKKLLTMLSRMYASYGFAYYETRLEALSLDIENIDSDVSYFTNTDIHHTKSMLEKYYIKGAEYALRALEVEHENCRASMADITLLDKFYQTLTKKDAPALFWYGFNLGGYANLNRDSVKALSKIHLVENTMLQVVELDPDYFYSGAHLYLTSFYASRSPMMGGKPDIARLHYDELIKRTGPGFLLAEVFYARYYLYQKQEREEFEKLLKATIASPLIKQYALFNQVAMDRARIYLKAIDDLFP